MVFYLRFGIVFSFFMFFAFELTLAKSTNRASELDETEPRMPGSVAHFLGERETTTEAGVLSPSRAAALERASQTNEMVLPTNPYAEEQNVWQAFVRRADALEEGNWQRRHQREINRIERSTRYGASFRNTTSTLSWAGPNRVHAATPFRLPPAASDVVTLRGGGILRGSGLGVSSAQTSALSVPPPATSLGVARSESERRGLLDRRYSRRGVVRDAFGAESPYTVVARGWELPSPER